MIVSKPKPGTLFSVGLFVIIAFAIFAYAVYQVQQTNDKFWWYVLVYTSGPIALVVLMKILTGIQVIKVAKGKFEIYAPFRFKRSSFSSQDLNHWTTEKIKTYGGFYEELVWKLNDGKSFKVSKQENSEFDKLLNYMKKKFKKLQK